MPWLPGLRTLQPTIFPTCITTTQLLIHWAYLIREYLGFLKLKDFSDSLDTENRLATEESPAWLTWIRLLQKPWLPTTVVVRTLTNGAPRLRLARGGHFLRSKVVVRDKKVNYYAI